MADNYRAKHLYQTAPSLQENHGTDSITAKGTHGHKDSSRESTVRCHLSKAVTTITGSKALKTHNQFYTSTGNLILQVTKGKDNQVIPSLALSVPSYGVS